MGERNLEARCHDRFSSFSHPFLRRLDPAPLGVTSEVPRCSLTNVGLEPLPSKVPLREAFRAPVTRQQAISLVSQRSTSALPRRSKQTWREVKHGRIAHYCPGPHPHPLIHRLLSRLGSTAAAPLGFVAIGYTPDDPTSSALSPGFNGFWCSPHPHYELRPFITSPSLLPINVYNVDLNRNLLLPDTNLLTD